MITMTAMTPNREKKQAHRTAHDRAAAMTVNAFRSQAQKSANLDEPTKRKKKKNSIHPPSISPSLESNKPDL
jgi:hypothetical protein